MCKPPHYETTYNMVWMCKKFPKWTHAETHLSYWSPGVLKYINGFRSPTSTLKQVTSVNGWVHLKCLSILSTQKAQRASHSPSHTHAVLLSALLYLTFTLQCNPMYRQFSFKYLVQGYFHTRTRSTGGHSTNLPTGRWPALPPEPQPPPSNKRCQVVRLNLIWNQVTKRTAE